MIFSSVPALVLAAMIGVSLGVLGSGGSVITLPVLVYIAKVPAKEAVGMSMAIVGATSALGALLQLRRGNVDRRAALIFAASGMAGSFVGSTGTHLLSKQALLLLFAAFMLIVGTLMLSGGLHAARAMAFSIPRCLAVGLAVGLLTGFLGIGGGFLIVPALMFSAGLNIRMACGTSLAVITLNSATGLIGQLRYIHVDWSLLAGFLLFAFGGMLAGMAVARFLNEAMLRRVFAIALITLATVVAAANIS